MITMGFVIWDRVSALFPSHFIKRSCMRFNPVKLKILMLQFILQIETISPVGIVRDVEVLCRKLKYPTDFLVLGSVQDSFFPIIFGRTFLRTCGAIIDFKKGKVSVEFNGEPYEFNFSKFSKQPRGTDLSGNDKIIEEIASIAIPPNDTLQQFMEDHENDIHMQERGELDDIFLRQTPILKHNLPVEPLGILSQPKEDPVFDLKPLPYTLKYAYLDV